MSRASSEDEECACRVCRFSWGIDLPVPQTGTENLQSLQTQASKLSALIFQNFVLLNTTLKRYEGVIQKRWIKKNNVQRTKILLTAWPGMAATHRPDFAQLRDIGVKNCRRRLNRVKEREANLWPHVNQEDLVQPDNLLTFLNSRGRCLPDKFSFGDNVCAHAARPSSKCEDINQRRMVLHDKHTPAAYAALHTFEAGDDTDMLGLHPITGLLVLEIQERILQFLVSCCRGILHDINIDHINLHPTKTFTTMTSRNSSTWRTVTSMTDEIPYRLPQMFDLERLCMLVEAKQSEAEEHLWSLREDPGYFSQELQEWAEHSTEMVLDMYKRRHKSVGKPAFWSRVCKTMIVHAYRSKVFLDELYEELKILIGLTKTHANRIVPSKRLPRPLEEAYQRLDKLVEEMRHEPLNELVVGLPASPPLRSGFERTIGDCTPSFHDLTAKKGTRGSTWRIHVLFRTLLSQDQHDKHGLINIVGEIQRTLDEHSADSDAITPWVANRFADLALVVEIRHQLDLFQPWCTMWRYHSEPVALHVDYETMALIDDVIVEVVKCRSVKLDVDPAALAYPSDKKRSQVTVARMRASEKELDSMWKKVDQHFVVHTGYTMHEFLADFLREPNRRLQRTPAWIEPEKSGGSRPVKQPTGEWVLKSLPLQQLDPNARCSHPGKAELLGRGTPEKVKVKSRPTKSRHRQNETAKPSKAAPDIDSTTRIKVNKRAYKVFSTMFHMPSAGEHTQGEVPWIEFLYAMSSIGFSPEKLYGSSWQFTPKDIDVNRSIQFHEPHPQVKMHFWLAKRVGRRLNRAYGWEGMTFVCE